MKGAQDMKKSNLITGFVYLAAGIICLLTAIFTDHKLGSLLFGFAGAGIGPGLVMIYKYFYWSRPKNRERYKEKTENEAIEYHDELKVKLRDRSGRYAYIFGLITISISIVVFSVLGQLEIIEHARMIVLYLGAYFILQLVIGDVFFRRLLKKYQ